jgi:hypothetical protein
MKLSVFSEVTEKPIVMSYTIFLWQKNKQPPSAKYGKNAIGSGL